MATWPLAAGDPLPSTNVNELNQRISNTVEAIGIDDVDANETTSSTSFTDLATAGPSVTVTCPSSKALVFLGADVLNTNSSQDTQMSFEVSGASTVAANVGNAYIVRRNAQVQGTRTVIMSSLSTGSNTFTAKYRTNTSGSTGTWRRRTIVVFPLGN